MRRLGLALLFALALTGLSACRRGQETTAASAARDAASSPAASPEKGVQTAAAEPPPRRSGRPLPAFSGFTLDDKKLDVSGLIGKRVLLLLFDPASPDAELALSAAARIADLRARQNFEIVGVATGASRDRARELAQRLKVSFPILDDSRRQISQQLGLRSSVALLGVDAEGYVTFGLPEFATGGDPTAARSLEEMLREALR